MDQHHKTTTIAHSLRTYWYNYLFIVVTIILIIQNLTIFLPDNPQIFLFLLLFLILVLMERFLHYSPKVNFIIVTAAYIIFMTPYFLFDVEFFSFIKVTLLAQGYFILLYQNSFSIIIVLAITQYKLLTYLPENYLHAVAGNILGISVNVTVYTVISFLIRKLTREKNKFKLLSIKDSLTDVFTLAHIIELGNTYLDKYHNITILLLDMNNFKQVNDTYGHLIGNKVLIQIANFLKSKLASKNCLVGRIGGDEFVVLFKGYTLNEVEKITERLYIDINDLCFELDPDIAPIQLSFAIGRSSSVSVLSEVTIDKLVQNATIDRYLNKYGKNRMDNNIQSFQNLFPYQINRFLNILAEKDMYTFIHSEYTAQYAASLARKRGLSESIVKDIYRAGWLHDIGKIFISNNILRKIGVLSYNEYEEIKHHITYGLGVIEPYHLSQTIINGLMYHHEQWDGKGYLTGLKGRDIPLEGRILKIADSFSAMIIKRVYRTPLTKFEALEEIKRQSNIQFDPELVTLFEAIFLKEEKNFISNTINKWIDISDLSFNNPEILIDEVQ